MVLSRARPTGIESLVMTDTGWNAGAGDRIEGRRPAYRIEVGARTIDLPGVTWADWDRQGRLIVATDNGHVQLRDGDDLTTVRVDHDLRELVPAPRPSPELARRW